MIFSQFTFFDELKYIIPPGLKKKVITHTRVSNEFYDSFCLLSSLTLNYIRAVQYSKIKMILFAGECYYSEIMLFLFPCTSAKTVF